jgi:phage terminase large subunit-like protein
MARKPNKDDLREIAKLIPGYDPFATAAQGDWFDEKAAQKACDFFPRYLTHVKGKLAGKPFQLKSWQKAIIANIFGWKRADGTRRYREVFIFVPRKNGKSLLSAGIILCAMFLDKEPGAELYSAAADRDQARLVFEMAKAMVLNNPSLASRANVFKFSITLKSDETTSYKAISSDAHTKHGYNTHLAVIDELHALADRELVDVLTTSTGARSQPLIVHVTTSDFERKSICNEKHDYAKKVRDGIRSESTFLPVIYEASNDADWKDPLVWHTANPNLGISFTEQFLQTECKRATEEPAF